MDLLKCSSVSGGIKASDYVLVSSDGRCFSDCESYDSDWSIGWSEPHAPEFLREGEIEDGFGVLIPCYVHSQGQNVDKKPELIDNNGHVSELYPPWQRVWST